MVWWIGDGPRNAGRIELGDESVSLSATTPGAGVEVVRFDELSHVLLDRGLLHVERHGAPAIRIGSLDTPGALRELADVLLDKAPARTF